VVPELADIINVEAVPILLMEDRRAFSLRQDIRKTKGTTVSEKVFHQK
jgi:hypothetical protein